MITSTGAVSNLFRPTVVRFEATNGAPPPESHNRPTPSPPPPLTPLLSVPKPSWIVRTESNVRLEKRRKPDPSCVVCRGSGRVDCYDCCGKGRRNNVELTMLPNGEWPKWCKTCGGSGLAYCSRCLGTGEYRYLMGFHFMKRNEDEAQDRDRGNYKVRDQFRSRKSAADLFQND
ncbi:protein SSUH2 homolog [Cynara cardunculus var. scolymus]|uniref:Heat shock protein DnaJ, cysteine-rich domain-containing protein n=1 Tax=Cynara cardunculus var. scolymus TaxID=59895 RepID=A0A103XEH2_CYNCS|nr:protein SSUH2 homolog [Cynara cardunculus var. scolymus]KVH89263.1 Heat shock protein DnaJ, cysteine-rich domain-containing protein [Cynara cardunculus var. scolymus]